MPVSSISTCSCGLKKRASSLTAKQMRIMDWVNRYKVAWLQGYIRPLRPTTNIQHPRKIQDSNSNSRGWIVSRCEVEPRPPNREQHTQAEFGGWTLELLWMLVVGAWRLMQPCNS